MMLVLINGSAGVAVDDTGSANNINDYEEGTWTPEVTAATTPPNSLTTGSGV